ncbi:hypothetical protein T484DRAFT_1926496 [Baffinella frigidus]|nr:hypothetical protein T484DRAFT_1926496 [Cryptophyta sp. CCMP2293]
MQLAGEVDALHRDVASHDKASRPSAQNVLPPPPGLGASWEASGRHTHNIPGRGGWGGGSSGGGEYESSRALTSPERLKECVSAVKTAYWGQVNGRLKAEQDALRWRLRCRELEKGKAVGDDDGSEESLLLSLEETIYRLSRKVEELEALLKQVSQNLQPSLLPGSAMLPERAPRTSASGALANPTAMLVADRLGAMWGVDA